jgi:RNA polymerase sigma factor (sigma-70 family)
MTKRYGDEEDIRQTISVTFFQCIKRYERKDSAKGPIPFSGFLYSYFFYLLKKNVDTFLIDQLGRKTFPLITTDSYDDEGENPQPGFRPEPVEYTLEQFIATDELNEMWVLGEKTIPPFDQLTVQERQLIKWRFVDGKKSSEISEKINEHPNTVREHLSKVKLKLRDIIIQHDMQEIIKDLNIKKDI